MHYYMPKRGVLSLHSGCNMGPAGDVTLFFGLSGALRCNSYRKVVMSFDSCNIAQQET
jgi:ATP-dependent phosphoenolpyruvate carboxykinase